MDGDPATETFESIETQQGCLLLCLKHSGWYYNGQSQNQIPELQARMKPLNNGGSAPGSRVQGIEPRSS
ncbi:hypothetical protein L1887_29253 [Cichorium endivia]|nr:hypothetical protein L1887_29253 [Cichorium endivia]